MSNLSQESKKSHPVTRFVGDVLSTERKIGDLNGKWAVMLKMTVLATTVVSPLIIAWAVWVTSNIFAVQHHLLDTNTFRKRIVDLEKQDTLTHNEIKVSQEDYVELKTDVKKLQEINTSEHKQIGEQMNNNNQVLSIQLTKIQTQLEDIKKKQ